MSAAAGTAKLENLIDIKGKSVKACWNKDVSIGTRSPGLARLKTKKHPFTAV
jgi:hypothetical protein